MPAIKDASKNPPWSRDEIILVLYLYKQQGSNISSATAQIYSEHLIDLAIINGIYLEKYKNFRSPDAIKLRISNFIGMDNRLPNKKGLDRKANLVLETWNEFENNFSELEKEAKKIFLMLETTQSHKKEIKEKLYEIHVREGGMRLFFHKRRERKPKIVSNKKKKTLKEKGFLSCEVCEFNFLEKYGKHGENFIECHHNKPLSEMKDGEKTYLSDLSLICSNCHRMIHQKKEYLTIKELKKIIEENKSY